MEALCFLSAPTNSVNTRLEQFCSQMTFLVEYKCPLTENRFDYLVMRIKVSF